MLLRIDGTPQWENRNNLFCCKVSFLRGPHCQFGGVGQDMKQTYLYQWYTLFQEQWDRCDEQNYQNYQTWNYLVKRHHMYSST